MATGDRRQLCQPQMTEGLRRLGNRGLGTGFMFDRNLSSQKDCTGYWR